MHPGNQPNARLSLAVILPDKPAGTPVVDCQGCGVCCREQSLPPFLDEIDFAPIALQREVLEARKHEADYDGLPCLWWEKETGKCRHHADRPNICREYEVGGELCLETRVKFGVK
ncbi:MAG TPA: YkgJ family cysteine cluster protein [Tepidisphaeraceae bacterium]|jgi:Fe-S-cluster containining protein|nr:YkgJ family cysteine cluster protein [Tepidisphaeraceae bacterium]